MAAFVGADAEEAAGGFEFADVPVHAVVGKAGGFGEFADGHVRYGADDGEDVVGALGGAGGRGEGEGGGFLGSFLGGASGGFAFGGEGKGERLKATKGRNDETTRMGWEDEVGKWGGLISESGSGRRGGWRRVVRGGRR